MNENYVKKIEDEIANQDFDTAMKLRNKSDVYKIVDKVDKMYYQLLSLEKGLSLAGEKYIHYNLAMDFLHASKLELDLVFLQMEKETNETT